MRTCAGEVPVLKQVVVMILHRNSIGVFRKRPESIQVDLVTEARGHSVHQESRAGSLDVDLVSEPVPDEQRSKNVINTCEINDEIVNEIVSQK